MEMRMPPTPRVGHDWAGKTNLFSVLLYCSVKAEFMFEYYARSISPCGYRKDKELDETRVKPGCVLI